jgi:threonine/homoserine/homoserine lactone efflux protein
VSGIHHYWLFVATGILLNLTPGQDSLFIIGRSLTGGFRAGLAATCGISLGTCCHTLAAALGLSLLLASSATAFTTVKLLGAAYLIYLGLRMLLARAAPQAAVVSADASASARAALLQGIATNLLNPKVALFFLAFLPQFVDAASPARALAFCALGLTFVTTGLAWGVTLAAGAARLQSFFLRNPNARTLLDRMVGAVFVALGTRLAWARP